MEQENAGEFYDNQMLEYERVYLEFLGGSSGYQVDITNFVWVSELFNRYKSFDIIVLAVLGWRS